MSSAQVPEGYKQTEVGVIPEDWQITHLKELIDPDRKITYGIVVPGPNIPNGIPMIRAQDYSRGWVALEDLYRVSLEMDKSYKRSKVKTGDILLTIVGSVGNLAKVTSVFNDSNLTQQTARLAFNKKYADSDFYLNILGSSFGQREILNYTKSGVQPSLNLSDIDRFQVPLPPLPEQRAIAQALSDVDSLITSLDKLIAKQRQLKTAAMQQLLMGKMRLPSFDEGKGYKQTEIGVIPEDWLTLKIGSLFDFKNGLNKAKEFFGNGTPIVNYMDVFNNPGLFKTDIFGKVNVTTDEIKAYGIKQGDVFFTRTSETVDEIGIATVLLEGIDNCVFSGFVLRARPKNLNLDLLFKKYCFASNIVRKQVTSTSSYTTRALTNGRLLSQVILPCPPEIEEQRAIATVLSDMDSAIAALEARRAKTQAIKQGMMQELLTGRTRLV